MMAFLFILSAAFFCPAIRCLHGTSNPYPPPRLILFPVTLVSKNDPGRIKNKEIHLDIAKGIWSTTIFVHPCNCITVLLIFGFACAVIHLSFDRDLDMLIDVVSWNKRIKFIRAETCKLGFPLWHLPVTICELCRSVPSLLSIFLPLVYIIRSPTLFIY